MRGPDADADEVDLFAQAAGGNFLNALPCVIYECNSSLELTFISNNISKLIGIEAKELIGNRLFWDERIVAEDWGLVGPKIEELKNINSVSMTHRLLNRRGLPVRVCHNLQNTSRSGQQFFQGCLLKIDDESPDQGLARSSVDLFLHKIGNQFQLLRLIINSLKKVLPESRETEVLHQTIDNAIELARNFSDYNQTPAAWSSDCDMAEVLQAASVRLRPDWLQKGVLFKDQTDPSLHSVSVSGDAYLLELAISHVLQNAVEATPQGGTVSLRASVESGIDVAPVVKVSIIDSGCGIEAKNLDRMSSPFFTTKEGRYGLGLSTAYRYIAMHSGLMQIRSVLNKGTEVHIVLPATDLKKPSQK